MTVVDTDYTVYLSDEVLISSEDVASARVIPTPAGPGVEITFNPSGQQKFATLHKNTAGKPLGILVDGNLLNFQPPAELVHDPGGKTVISTGLFSHDEATRIAGGIVLE